MYTIPTPLTQEFAIKAYLKDNRRFGSAETITQLYQEYGKTKEQAVEKFVEMNAVPENVARSYIDQAWVE